MELKDLDIVLKLIKSHEGRISLTWIEIDKQLKGQGNNYKDDILDLILDKLEKDNVINVKMSDKKSEFQTQIPLYRINYDGIQFLSKGGYYKE